MLISFLILCGKSLSMALYREHRIYEVSQDFSKKNERKKNHSRGNKRCNLRRVNMRDWGSIKKEFELEKTCYKSGVF